MKKKQTKLEWEEAPEIKKMIAEIIKKLELLYIDSSKITAYRSYGSKSRSYARIWSFPKIFQRALNIEPHYVVEVLAKYFDKLKDEEKNKVIIHELLHIPKNFSGALLAHKVNGRSIEKLANELLKKYKEK